MASFRQRRARVSSGRSMAILKDKEESAMNDNMQRAQAYQILALNDEMLRGGHISREEHEFVRRLQAQKLTNLHGRGTIEVRKQDLT